MCLSTGGRRGAFLFGGGVVIGLGGRVRGEYSGVEVGDRTARD